ncbi:MAG: transglycosylase SLT domain-containing protein [Rhizobiaceae bacterium]
MSKFHFLFVAFFVPFVLSGCQTSQVGTSSFAGSNLNGSPVKQRASIQTNEAASSAIKKPKKKAVRAAKQPTGPRIFTNEAASSAIRPVARTTKVSTKTAKKKAAKKTASKSTKKRSKKKTVVAKVSRKRGGKFSARRKRYARIIAKHARANGVPIRLAMAVVQVESSYRASARGAAGEIGLMQLMPSTARFIGYKGPLKRLYNPNTNIRYGMKYLGKAYKLGGRSVCGAILKYNAGHGAKRMNPISRKYCKRVRRIMRRG